MTEKTEEPIMEEVPNKDLTAEEKKFLVKVLSTIPLQGNLQTLPKAMEDVMTIIRKLS